MKRKWRIAIFMITALLLITAAGCGSDKPLWMVLEEQQYNSYKPRLDYMVKKYGDMFEMDVYGEVYCTDPEYKDWHIGISGNGGADDFAIRLRRDDLEQFMMEIAEPIFGQCKIYIHDGYPNTLGADADIEDFFTYNDEWGLVEYRIYVPYSEDYQIQGEALVAALKSRNYTLSNLDILFFEEEVYEQADRNGKLPEGYQFRLKSGHYDKWKIRWIENTGLTYMTEKYGDMFKMELDGTIICTDPEYQDWDIIIMNNTEAQYDNTDNFMIRLRRDDLELFMQRFAESVFGECKAYVIGGRASTLDVDADTEKFFTNNPERPSYYYPHIVSVCICVPYGEDYHKQAETFTQAVLESGYKLNRVILLYYDEELYAQVARMSKVYVDIQEQVIGAEGYRVALYRHFSDSEHYRYFLNRETDLYWYEIEG